MSTSMHRLQISLPREQMHYLQERAKRDGSSAAEIIRQLIQREAESTTITDEDIEAALNVVGLGEDRGPLIDGIPVSQNPHLYLAELSAPRRASRQRRTSK
jgi:hypothetical protein